MMRLPTWLVLAALVVGCREPADYQGDTQDASTMQTDDSGAFSGRATLGELSPAELWAELQHKDFLLIDVHTPYAGRVPGTDASIPYTNVDALTQYIGSDLGRQVVLTCLSDHMSRIAGNALLDHGYRSVRHLAGGMNAWLAAGYSLEP
jgi:phage shock protein E